MTPPSAKDYAAAVVVAMFSGGQDRRSLTRTQADSLIRTAYDAGVLAQQRFAEKTDV